MSDVVRIKNKRIIMTIIIKIKGDEHEKLTRWKASILPPTSRGCCPVTVQPMSVLHEPEHMSHGELRSGPDEDLGSAFGVLNDLYHPFWPSCELDRLLRYLG